MRAVSKSPYLDNGPGQENAERTSFLCGQPKDEAIKHCRKLWAARKLLITIPPQYEAGIQTGNGSPVIGQLGRG